jgi:long-subunit fatty acid transport protein
MNKTSKKTSLKKVALSAFLFFAIIPIQAQWYVGGRISMSQTSERTYPNSTAFYNTIKISPEFGYSFTPQWSIGLNVDFQKCFKKKGFELLSEDGTVTRKTGTVCTLNPYVRFSFFNSDKLSLFVDATASLDVLDTRYWSAGFCPGISYALTDHFLAVAKAGFFGYNNEPYKWEANMDLSKLNVSLFYVFPQKEKK